MKPRSSPFWGRVALLYFALVFGAGFLLGLIRVWLLEPRIGPRWAELCEMPLMLLAICFSARWIVRGPGVELGSRQKLGVGLSAMASVLVVDFIVGVGLRGMRPLEVFTHRDPVSGTAYYLSLLMFGLLPWWLDRSRPNRGPDAGQS